MKPQWLATNSHLLAKMWKLRQVVTLPQDPRPGHLTPWHHLHTQPLPGQVSAKPQDAHAGNRGNHLVATRPHSVLGADGTSRASSPELSSKAALHLPLSIAYPHSVHTGVERRHGTVWQPCAGSRRPPRSRVPSLKASEADPEWTDIPAFAQ